MQMVVNIPEKDYEYAKAYMYGRCNVLAINNTSRILGAIADGTLLPKGHGRLIDADEVEELEERLCATECECCTLDGCFYDRAETIIEADRREE